MPNGGRKAFKEWGPIDQLDRGIFATLEGNVFRKHRNSALGPFAGASGLNTDTRVLGSVQQESAAQQSVPFEAAFVIMQEVENLLAGPVNSLGY